MIETEGRVSRNHSELNQRGNAATEWLLVWQRRQERIQALREGKSVDRAGTSMPAGPRHTAEQGSKSFDYQMSFLPPRDAEMLHLLKRFVAEASRLYENRTGQDLDDALHIRSPADAYEFLRLEMEGLEQEQLRTINLDVKNRIISSQMIYQGTVGSTFIRVAEVFRPAIIDNAAGIIVAHNHPSGSLEASGEDIRLTRVLVDAGKLLDLEVLDHLIVSKKGFVSLKERGLGFD